MGKRRRWRVRMAAGIVVTLALASAAFAVVAGCGEEEQQGLTPKPIKIGILYPVSGSLATFGQECVDASELAVDEINKAGGIASLGGAPLKLVAGDTASEPATGLVALETLSSDAAVAAVLGPYGSGVGVPAAREAERLRIPLLVTMAVADSITEQGYQYVFRLCPKADWYAATQIGFCAALEDMAGYRVDRVALLHGNSEFGQSTAKGQRKYARAAGMTVVGEVEYPVSRTALTTEVSRVARMKPDVVLTTTYLDDAVMIANERVAQKITTPFFDAAGGTVETGFVEKAGEAAEGWLGVIEYSKYPPGMSTLNDNFRAKAGHDISGNGAYAYQAVYVIADVLERAASTDRDKVRAALAATKMTKSGGARLVIPVDEIAFGADGQITTASTLYVFQVQSGELKPVFPPQYSITDVRLQE